MNQHTRTALLRDAAPSPASQLARLFAVVLALAFAFSLVTGANAQDLTADEVLARVQQSAEGMQDATFLLTGRIIDADGGTINLEIDVQVIPDQELLRAEFFQPDALADNYIIVDGDSVYNYLFLTNQVTILRVDDPDALGGLFPDAEEEIEGAQARLDYSLDLEQMFRGFVGTIEGYQPSPVGNVYLMAFRNEDLAANIQQVNVQIVEGEWRPYRIEFLEPDGRIFAELTFNDFERDVGLDPEDLRFLPADAEIIDER